MCILFCYTNPNPGDNSNYRLIIASNRDEYYTRPARQAFQCQETDIIGGRDMEKGREGGMWLGISLKPNLLKFGALLNVTGAKKRIATKGRGPLVVNYLKSEQNAPEYITEVQKDDSFSSFNLVMAEIRKHDGEETNSFHYSNSPEKLYRWRGEQCLGFGNSTPESPLNKVESGRKQFEKIVKANFARNELVERLVGLLKSSEKFLPDEELKRRTSENVYEFLSSIYVELKDGGYGTRTHSIILVDSEYNVEFIEYTMREPVDIEAPEWDVTVLRGKL